MGIKDEVDGWELVLSKLHIVMVNFTEKSWMLYSLCPALHMARSRKRVTALLVFHLIPMQPTLRIHHPSPSSHPDAKKYSDKHLYYKSRNVGQREAISARQYLASKWVGSSTAGSRVSHLCHHPM
jgi:hypothetical protein